MGAGSARTSAVCLAWKTLVAGLAPGGLGAWEAPIKTFPQRGKGWCRRRNSLHSPGWIPTAFDANFGLWPPYYMCKQLFI